MTACGIKYMTPAAVQRGLANKYHLIDLPDGTKEIKK